MTLLGLEGSRYAAIVGICAMFLACGGDGKTGAPGAQGEPGEAGPAGGAGPTGAEGEPGASALVNVTPIDPGADCPEGGLSIESGTDSDRDGELSADEVTQQSFVCNGLTGADGTSGADGTDGADGMSGADGMNGMDGANGMNGMNGANGMNGSNGASALVKVSIEGAGINCSMGGRRIDTGLDNGDGEGTAGDGTLQAGEIDQTTYVCTPCPDSDGDGLCDAVDRCPRNARVAAWFPANTGETKFKAVELVDAFVAELAGAKNITSVTLLPDTANPTLGELLTQFDALIIGSDGYFAAKNPDQLGDLLADYVDAGGVVVTTMFVHTNFSDELGQEFLGGRWNWGGYNALNLAPQINAARTELAMTNAAPTDPLMVGFNPASFLMDLSDAKQVFLTQGSLNTTSTLGFVELARWTYGGQDYPAIAVSRHRDKRVLALSLSPVWNFNNTNTETATRDLLACGISRLVH